MSLLNSLIPAAHAATTGAPGSHQGSIWSMIWLPILIIVVFYFLLIRPQSKRAKEHRNLLANISVGDEVVTTGGILAKVLKLRDNFVVVQVSGDVQLTLQKSSIAQVLPKGTIDASQ